MDYETDYDAVKKCDQIVSRASPGDLSYNMTFLALNSSYIFYTKLFFIKYDES